MTEHEQPAGIDPTELDNSEDAADLLQGEAGELAPRTRTTQPTPPNHNTPRTEQPPGGRVNP